jgi:hypothetical protein
MFNFKVFDDLRNDSLVTHEMYLKNPDKSAGICLNRQSCKKIAPAQPVSDIASKSN